MVTMYLRPDTRAEIWLSPPSPVYKLDPKAATQTRRAITRLKNAARDATPVRMNRVLLAEAYASSRIEGIDEDPTQAGNFSHALRQALGQALADTDPAGLTRWHFTLMQNHPDPRMRPGQYRNCGVRVGNWLPPHHNEIPRMMDGFLAWMKAEPDPLMRAVWGHRYFETIHPFADGNGRVGRLLICQALNCPVMVSRHIWWQRRDYVTLLGAANWQEWSEWLLSRIREAAYLTARDLRRGPVGNTDFRAAQWLVQEPLPRLNANAGFATMMQFHRMIQNRIKIEQ